VVDEKEEKRWHGMKCCKVKKERKMKRDQPRQQHEARPNTIGANDDING
jgi:hypothetical protein